MLYIRFRLLSEIHFLNPVSQKHYIYYINFMLCGAKQYWTTNNHIIIQFRPKTLENKASGENLCQQPPALFSFVQIL